MPDAPANCQCHGFGCRSRDLIEAHIVPKGFARFIRQAHHNVILTKERTRRTPQLGVSDWNILCSKCDGWLGRYDDALLNAAKNFRRLHHNAGLVWELPDVNPDEFAKGLFAILWRASLSQRDHFAPFTLGRYQDIVRDIIFGAKAFCESPALSLLVQRYTSKRFDPSKFYTDPSLAPFMGLEAGGLGLAGFRFLAKFDDHPLDPGYANFDVTRCGIVRGLYMEVEKTPEFEHISQMVAASIRRSDSRDHG